MSPNNQIQNGYAQYGQTQYGHAQQGHAQHGQAQHGQGHAQTSNHRTPGAAAGWTQPLVQAQNNYFTVSKPPPQPSSASLNAISSEKKTKMLEDKPPSMTYLMKKSKCDSKKDPKDWQKEYEERKKQLAMGGALVSSSPPKKQEQKPSVTISQKNSTSSQNLLTFGSCSSTTAPSSDSKSENIENLIMASPPKVQKLQLVRRNSVDNKAHEEAEQDKLASILAFQPKNHEKPTESLIKKSLVSEEYQEPLDGKPTESLIRKSLVSEEYQEPLVNKSIVPLTSENEAHSALYYQNYQAPPIVQKPTASPRSALTTSGSGPSTAAPSSGDSKRKVEEKAPDIQKLMKKAKCDSSRDANDWQKEYEERKKLAMAAFKS